MRNDTLLVVMLVVVKVDDLVDWKELLKVASLVVVRAVLKALWEQKLVVVMVVKMVVEMVVDWVDQ